MQNAEPRRLLQASRYAPGLGRGDEFVERCSGHCSGGRVAVITVTNGNGNGRGIRTSVTTVPYTR